VLCSILGLNNGGLLRKAYPTPTAPANSITVAIIIACFIVRDLEDTEVAKEFATSFAPIETLDPNTLMKKKIYHTNVPSIEKRKDHANGKYVIKLMENRHCEDE
jgi:hypothetical protein